MVKKNKVYVNKIDKKINNNQSYYNISDVNNNSYEIKESNNVEEVNTKVIEDNVIENDNLSVREKLTQIFNRNGYTFNVNVKIITNIKEYNTKIAGRVNDHIITLDNDIININDIKDIVILN